jgi:Signal transduction histidine kinase
LGLRSNISLIFFDRFWRADPDRRHHDGGSGLGLAIAQAIAHHHGGKITVTSQPGLGSQFQVYFPVHGTIQNG